MNCLNPNEPLREANKLLASIENTKVYKYGSRPAGDDVREQMRLGHVYYNQLVEAENERRVKIWGGPHAPAPPHDDCPDDPCSPCKSHWKTIRDAVYANPQLDIKPLRAARPKGLYWGTYNKIEEAFNAARKWTNTAKSIRFRSWGKSGQVAAVQIQKGVNPDRIFRIALAPDPSRTVEHGLCGDQRNRGSELRRHDSTSRRAGHRRTLQIRIGSIGIEPKWSTPIPFIMHRQLRGVVVGVLVCKKRVADREVWSVQFVCRKVAPDHSSTRPRSVVAIDVGWRKVPGGEMRIAFARSNSGTEYQFHLPPEWSALTKKADDIQSIRDNRVNELKASNKLFARIRSPGGVARLVAMLRKAGTTIESEVVDWLKQDRHLWQYEEGLRRRSTNRRRNDMRVWLRMLSNKYAIVVIKASSHKAMKEKKKDRLPKPARRQGHHAAPGEVIEEITRYFGRMKNVALVEPAHTTNTCIKCEHVNNHGPEQVITCEQCGYVADRDSVSTRNMLAAYHAGHHKKPTPRKPTHRFAKRHKK